MIRTILPLAAAACLFLAGGCDLELIEPDTGGPSVTPRLFRNFAQEGSGADVVQAADGSYWVVGTSNGANRQIKVVRIDAAGNVLAAQEFGTADAETTQAAALAPDGGLVVVAQKSGGQNYFIIKISPALTVQLQTADLPAAFRPTSIAALADGYVLAGGLVDGPAPQAALARINAGLNRVWDVRIPLPAGATTSRLQAVRALSTGGFLAAGTATAAGGGNGAYLLRTDANGQVQGINKTLGPGVANTLTVLSDGYLLAGEFEDPNTGNTNIQVIKTDAEGNALLTRTDIGGPNYDIATGLALSDAGNPVVAGAYSFNFRSVYLFELGQPALNSFVWSKTYDDSANVEAYPAAIRRTSDGGFVVCGTRIIDGTNYIYVIKSDDRGEIE